MDACSMRNVKAAHCQTAEATIRHQGSHSTASAANAQRCDTTVLKPCNAECLPTVSRVSAMHAAAHKAHTNLAPLLHAIGVPLLIADKQGINRNQENKHSKQLRRGQMRQKTRLAETGGSRHAGPTSLFSVQASQLVRWILGTPTEHVLGATGCSWAHQIVVSTGLAFWQM